MTMQAHLPGIKRAEAIQPERNELHRGMASVYRFTGDIDKAGEACNKALATDPHDYEMLNLRSSLRRQTRNDNHIQELKERLEKGVRDWRGAVQVAYAVSKELEDIEEYDEAFQYLEKGASLRRRNLKYDLNDDIKIFHAIKSAFHPGSPGGCCRSRLCIGCANLHTWPAAHGFNACRAYCLIAQHGDHGR